jgi:hypothetical protein
VRCDDTICVNQGRIFFGRDNWPCASIAWKNRNLQFHHALFSRDLNQALTYECWAKMICWTHTYRDNVSIVMHSLPLQEFLFNKKIMQRKFVNLFFHLGHQENVHCHD